MLETKKRQQYQKEAISAICQDSLFFVLFLFCAKCSHRNIIIRLVEMREEEDVEQL